MIARTMIASVALLAAMPAVAQTAPAQPAQVSAQPALPGAAPAPKPTAPAQTSRNAPINGVLVLFGNEKCPTDSSGNEVVVCTHRGASEQFRIPKEMRDFKVTPENEAWAAKLAPVMAAGDSGIGSCSTVGPGGSTGCMTQQFRAARAENRERKADEAEAP